MLLIKVILLINIISKSLCLLNKDDLKRHVRQGLDIIAQDILAVKSAAILHDYKFDSGFANREELIVKQIKLDRDFNFGEDVTEWQSISIPEYSVMVGLTSNGFTILKIVLDKESNKGYKITAETFNTSSQPIAFTLHKEWKKESKKYDIFLVIVVKDNLEWFHITQNIDLERIFWKSLSNTAIHLKLFQCDDSTKLLIINEKQNNSDATSAEIYDIDKSGSNITLRLTQTIVLDTSAKSSAINNIGSNIYLSIPQQQINEVHLFKYTSGKFLSYHTISSKNVAFVTSFNIGYRSYLAIGGYDSAIYRFSRSGIKKRPFHEIKFEEVTFFLPLPVKSYRDEVLILVQHNIDYHSHSSPIVKVLTYSKGAFKMHDEIPCDYFGATSFGATCMVDMDLDNGLYGSAALVLGKKLGVVVPRDIVSGLFIFDWELEQIENPISQQIDKVINAKIKIEETIKEQQEEIERIQRKVNNSLSLKEPNEITGEWKINTLITPNVIYETENQAQLNTNDFNQNLPSFSIEQDFKSISDEIDQIKIKILTKRSDNTFEMLPDIHIIDNLKIKGNLEVLGTTNVEKLYVTKVNDDVFDDVVKDCVKKSEYNTVSGTKTFKQVNANRIYFEKLNNNSAEDISYIDGNDLYIKGDVIFENTLNIIEDVNVWDDGLINNMKLKDELVHMDSDRIYDYLKFENIDAVYMDNVEKMNDQYLKDIIQYEYDDKNYYGLNIEADYMDLSNISIEAKNINDEDFVTFINKICLTNIECSLQGNLTVKGNLKVIAPANIETLNGLKYPDEYVLSKEPELFTKITGKKTFLGNFSTFEANVEGTINGINPDEIITLSSNQHIPGNFTFSNLEITESFQVDGDILVGPNLTKFNPNPSLEQTNYLNTDVSFTSLEVDGVVIVNNLFNNVTVKQLLEDVVYKDEDVAIINSEKKLTNRIFVENNLNVLSNKINNININDLLTYETDQIVKNNTITGRVVIKNLEVDGLFLNQNMTKFFDDLILLDRDEIINNEIIIQNFDDDPDIIANELYVETVNKLNISDLYLITGNRTFENVEFVKLKAENVEFKKDLNYGIECLDLEDFNENRFSLTKDQNITGQFRVINGSLTNVHTEMLNDVEWDFVKSFLNISDIFYGRLINGELNIEELIVNNSIKAEYLNGKNLKKLYKNAFWLNKTNHISSKIIFENEVKIKELRVQNINNNKFEDTLGEIVPKNDKNIILNGHKTFKHGFTVKGDLDTDFINEIPVENILLASTDQVITSNVNISGNVWVEDNLNVEKTLNTIPMDIIKNRFLFKNNTFILLGNVTFKNHNVTIKNLHVHGKANDIKAADYLGNIVCVTDDVTIKGTTVFKRKVRVRKNLGVATTVDGVNLNKLMDEVVLISSDNFINGIVTFMEDIAVTDMLEINGDLDTRFVHGCDLEEWKKNAVYLQDGHVKGKIKFEEVSILSNIDVQNLNNFSIDSLIPLHTNQTIDETMNLGFVRVENDIEVGNFVEGFNLTEEYENTVLMNTDQEIDTMLIFKNPVKVLQNLKTSSLVNGQDLQRLVTTNTDQNLTASYIFKGKVTIDSDLFASGNVNTINITEWQKRTVTSSGPEEQHINDLWRVKGNVTFEEDVLGNGLLGTLDVKNMAREVERKMQEKDEFENARKKDYKESCLKVQEITSIAKNIPYVFKYLEYHDNLDSDYPILAVHHFKHNHNNYLLVSQKETCFTLLYTWVQNTFNNAVKLRTGEVEQFLTINETNKVIIVSRNSKISECPDMGINIWTFEDNILTHMYALNNSVLLAKANKPDTFYSLDSNFITEYKLHYEEEIPILNTYKRWNMPIFDPVEFQLDMSQNEYYNNAKKSNDYVDFKNYIPEIKGNISIDSNLYLPGFKIKEFVTFYVAHDPDVQLTAVAVWEEVTVNGMTDEIRVYENLKEGKLFDKILTYRPSNLNVLEFGKSGETLLLFLENYEKLKIYEYKGLKGLKLRSSIEMKANKMLTMSLPVSPYQSKRKFVMIVNEYNMVLLQAVMDGDRPNESFQCET